MNKNFVFGGIIIISIIAIGYLLKYPDVNFGNVANLLKNKKEKIANSPAKDVSAEEVKKIATDFIEKNMVKAGTKFEIKNVSEEYDLYKLEIDVDGQSITSYISKDGKNFFPSVIEIAELEKTSAEKNSGTEEEKEIPKTDKPQVDLYVMSFCPFGNKAEDTLKSAYDLLKNKVDFNFYYIVNSNGDEIQSLHGEKEVAQNEREACVLRDYGKDKWMNFVSYVNKNCGSDGSCWTDGAKGAGIDVTKIENCVKSDGLALMKKNEEASSAAGASGSPTMMINGVKTSSVYQYGNSEAYKQAICSAFNNAPEECNKKLETSGAAATAGGSCN